MGAVAVAVLEVCRVGLDAQQVAEKTAQQAADQRQVERVDDEVAPAADPAGKRLVRAADAGVDDVDMGAGAAVGRVAVLIVEHALTLVAAVQPPRGRRLRCRLGDRHALVLLDVVDQRIAREQTCRQAVQPHDGTVDDGQLADEGAADQSQQVSYRGSDGTGVRIEPDDVLPADGIGTVGVTHGAEPFPDRKQSAVAEQLGRGGLRDRCGKHARRDEG